MAKEHADPRLHVMMFLEYAVKALWFPLASIFLTASVESGGLGFTQAQKGSLIGLPMALGAVCGPLIVGPLADRYFPTQKMLGVMLVLAGIIKIVTAYQTAFAAWLVLMMFYAVLYVPTISLTNSLAMAHLKDPKRQFPPVRVWGTISWIIASWAFPMIWLQSELHFQWLPPFLKGTEVPQVTGRMIDGLKVAGVVAIGFGLFCYFCLPDTPPRHSKVKSLVIGDAMKLLRIPSFSLLMLVTLLISVLHTIYFVQTGEFLVVAGLDKSSVMPAMSVGQFSEIAGLAVLGWFLSRFGFRAIMTFGAACFCVRFAIFGIPGLPISAYVVAQGLHGFCFACFYAAGFIYVERLAPREIHHTAQTIFILVMMGVGPVAATYVNKWLAGAFLNADAMAAGFSKFWWATAAMGLLATVIFAVFFRDESRDPEAEAGS